MFEPKIFVASDGDGHVMKREIVQHLSSTNKNFSIVDVGPQHEESVDFPVYALMVADLVKEKPGDHFGVLISKNGNEMAVAANKIKDIRAVVCWNLLTAEQGRTLLDANILCLPSDVITSDSPLDIIDEFIRRKPSDNPVHFRRRYLLEKLIDAL
jgi:ribose 5-phosphate isomerase B